MINLKSLLTAMLLTSAFACPNIANAQTAIENERGKMYLPGKCPITSLVTSSTRTDDSYDQMEKALACPEGTVYGSSFKYEDGQLIGSMCADEGRSGLATVFYQSIEDNIYAINGIRFFGVFNYYNREQEGWFYCNERGNIAEDGTMTTPIRMRITFNEENNGKPGKEIFSKEFDIIGNNTGVMMGDESVGFCNIYSFEADLGEYIKMERGFIGITAVNMGDKPQCWFSIFTSGNALGYGVVGINKGSQYMEAIAPACICLKGTGELNTKKAIRLERFLAPSKSSNGKYEKVGIEISNCGSEPVSDVELELWKDGEFICRDKIATTIDPISKQNFDGKYKHIFSKTVDCSKEGENVITVKNVYKEDEGLCPAEKSMTIIKLGDNEVVESKSEVPGYYYLSNVNIGSINNTTEGTSYSDFTDMKTEIFKGDECSLSVTTDEDCNVFVWVDWDNNGNFGENGEFIGRLNMNTINISIPNGVDVKPGDKRMRIVCTVPWEMPTYSGLYENGETEDYTLTVMRNYGEPGFDINSGNVELSKNEDGKAKAFNILNNGESNLNVKASVNYILPGSPDCMNISHSAAQVPEMMLNMVKTQPITSQSPSPMKSDATQLVLGYDRGAQYCTTLKGKEAVYGQLYPQQMLSNIKNMTISSVDVYVGSIPNSSSIQIYEENKNSNRVGKLLLEQAFDPIENSWNRVILDTPLTITGEVGLLVAVKMAGFEEGNYYIGTDAGEAVIGYGDIVGFNGYLWSTADLGSNCNYCIRANVTGEKTPAISWLDLSVSDFNIAAGESHEGKVSYNGTQLDNYLYTAIVEFETNDELRKNVRIPVYFINDTESGIISADLGESKIVYADNEIKVTSSKSIFNIQIYDVNGQLLENVDPSEGETTISTLNYNRGIYLISVMYADGNRQSVKIPVIK